MKKITKDSLNNDYLIIWTGRRVKVRDFEALISKKAQDIADDYVNQFINKGLRNEIQTDS